ncbi:MAG TPA: rhodanese-like domain-containing protein [Ignavibacteria bacterium]|nr:rhodanese-like domain-containing protein [Ignavibacteria bacterium]HMR39426.1 rhodanese-like domain-containing protein [Ignavibacteria bacterium]
MKHKDIDTKEFKKFFEENSFVLLDVRTEEEFKLGHIKDASNIDFYHGSFEASIDELDKRERYLVYCRSGNRSRQTMFLMRDLGFDEVYNLEGGIIAWNDEGFEIHK